MLTLSARGVRDESDLAYSGLRILLQPVLAHLTNLSSDRAAALRKVLDPEQGAGSTPAGGHLVGTAVLDLLATAAARRPVLLAVDDLPLFDAATAKVLLFVVRRLAGTGVAALLSAATPLPPSLAQGDLPLLALRGLDPEAAGQLMAEHGWRTSAPARAAAVTATGGNPLALVELARLDPVQRLVDIAAAITIPLGGRLSAAYRAPIAALPAQTRAILLVAAAERKGWVGPVLAAGRRLGLDLAALAPAERAGIVSVLPQSIAFRHPLLRVGAYQESTVAERIAVHGALAEVLHEMGESDAASWQRALGATGPDDALAADVERAAPSLEQRSGSTLAAAVLHVAARLSTSPVQRARREIAAAQAAWRSGQIDLARALTDELDGGLLDARTEARVARLRGLVELGSGDPVTALHVLEAGAGLVTRTAPFEAASLLVAAVEAANHAGDEDGWTRAALAIAALGGPFQKLGKVFAATMRGAMPSEGTKPLELAGAVPDGFAGQGGLRHIWTLGISTVGPHQVLTREYGLWVCAKQRAAGMIGTLAVTLVWLAEVEFHLGLWATGTERAEESLGIARDTGQHARTAHALAMLARFAAVRGDHTESLELAAEASSIAIPLRNRAAAASASWATALVALAEGDPATARDRLLAVATPGTSCSHPLQARLTAPDLVEAAVRSDDLELARATTAAAEGWASTATVPWARPYAQRCSGLVRADSDDDADSAFGAALAGLERAARPFDQARTALLLGEWLRRTRRRGEARAALRRAVELFDELGAARWAAAARVQLRGAGGVHGGRLDGTVSVQLTTQEAQVVRLAAAGLSNKEIASQLFVSPRTVGYHLYNVFPKLGVSSRAQLRDLDLRTRSDPVGNPEPAELPAPAASTASAEPPAPARSAEGGAAD